MAVTGTVMTVLGIRPHQNGVSYRSVHSGFVQPGLVMAVLVTAIYAFLIKLQGHMTSTE